MTEFNTLNPVPSSDVRDLLDNATIEDKLVNGLQASYPDRFGRPLKSKRGMELDFSAFLAASGFELPALEYVDGSPLVVDRPTQLISRDGILYSVKAIESFPANLAGMWAADQARLVVRTDSDFRQDLANADDPSKGAGLVGRATQSVNSVADLRLLSTSGPSKYAKTLGYYAAGDGGCGEFFASSAALSDDGGSIILADDGGFWVLKDRAKINVMQFGAIQGDDTLATAVSNTAAFRAACLSYKSKWDAWKVGKQSRSIYVPPGDYNLSNGFTVPTGCALFSDGLGVARLKVLNATADIVNVLPLVSLSRVIDDITFVTEPSTGAYVIHPAPQIDNLYLNPQNSGTALYIKDVPGFKVGSLWIQAETGVHVWASGDGTFGDLMIEDSTGTGVLVEESQNLMFGKVYTFSNNIGIKIGATNNNIHISELQSNYSKFFAVEFGAGTFNRSISFGHVTVNQNTQHVTFSGGVSVTGAAADVSIGTLECRNANGFAAVVSGFNQLSIGAMKLKQLIGNATYTQGTTLQGISASGSATVNVGSLFSEGLRLSPVVVAGTPIVTVGGGWCSGFAAAVPVFNISAAVAGAVVTVSDFRGAASEANSCPLFAPSAGVDFRYSRVDDAFAFVPSGGRAAVFLPFNSGAELFDIALTANPNPAGNPDYKRTLRATLLHESVFVAAFVNQLFVSSVIGAAGIVPNIDMQVDYTSVGGGNNIAHTSSGYLVISVPSTYTNLKINIDKL